MLCFIRPMSRLVDLYQLMFYDLRSDHDSHFIQMSGSLPVSAFHRFGGFGGFGIRTSRHHYTFFLRLRVVWRTTQASAFLPHLKVMQKRCVFWSPGGNLGRVAESSIRRSGVYRSILFSSGAEYEISYPLAREFQGQLVFGW